VEDDTQLDAQVGLPIRLGDVLQVGMLVRNLRKSMETCWTLLGVGPRKIYTYGSPGLRETTLRGESVVCSF
jgi:hypothetical protein